METITTPPAGVIVKSDSTGRTRYTSQYKAQITRDTKNQDFLAPCREVWGMGLPFRPRIAEVAGFVMAWLVSIWCLWLALGISSGAGAALISVVQVPVFQMPGGKASVPAAVEIVRGSKNTRDTNN